MQSKIISINDALKLKGKVALCYGTFNVLHPGHFRYFEHAKELCSNLLVAVRSDSELNKRNSEFFSGKERALSISNLSYINNVILLDKDGLGELINKLKPSFFIVGSEFKDIRRNEIDNEIKIIEKYGGSVVFHSGSINYLKSTILQKTNTSIDFERMKEFKDCYKKLNLKKESLLNLVEKISKIKFLIIGDTIVDQYINCEPLGMSAEAPLIVLRELEAKKFVGGAAIVASHINSLGSKSKFISVLGMDENSEYIKSYFENKKIENMLIEDNSRPTTFKTRYVVQSQKMFRVSRLSDHSISDKIELRIIDEIRKNAKDFDGILVSDFVYGIITPKIVNTIKQLAREFSLHIFGDTQCSSQIGNIHKFKDFTLICPTEKEVRISLSKNDSNIENIANETLNKLNLKNLIITLGDQGFITYYKNKNDEFAKRQHFPALISNPVDVTGAGDSLLASVSLAITAGGSIMEASIIGACSAALAVQSMGNNPTNKSELLRYIKKIVE